MKSQLLHYKKVRKIVLLIASITLTWILLREIFDLIIPPLGSHPVQQHNMTVIAHQGGAFLFPDNTMSAFEGSVAMGVDVLEMDVHLSKDGHLVVIHDDSVDRTTNDSGKVVNLTLTELKRLDAAYKWVPSLDSDSINEEFPYRGRGIEIPALEEVLLTFPEIPKVIEMKPNNIDTVRVLGDLLRDYDQEAFVIVTSFHFENLKEFRRLYPEFATGASQPEITAFFILNHLGLAGSYPSQAQFFQVPVKFGIFRIITKSFIRNAHRSNIFVHAWTINDSDTMRELLNMGIDGIITDNPVELAFQIQ